MVNTAVNFPCYHIRPPANFKIKDILNNFHFKTHFQTLASVFK